MGLGVGLCDFPEACFGLAPRAPEQPQASPCTESGQLFGFKTLPNALLPQQPMFSITYEAAALANAVRCKAWEMGVRAPLHELENASANPSPAF
jgi:hypothetical protein